MLRIGITVKNKRKTDEGEKEVRGRRRWVSSIDPDQTVTDCSKKKSITSIEKSQTERNRQSTKPDTTQVLENETEGVGEKEKEACQLLQ